MLELLISIMITLNIQYTVVDGKQVQISSHDSQILLASPEYQKSSSWLPLEEIVITDEVDPTSSNK